MFSVHFRLVNQTWRCFFGPVVIWLTEVSIGFRDLSINGWWSMGRKGWGLNVSKNRVERQGYIMILLTSFWDLSATRKKYCKHADKQLFFVVPWTQTYDLTLDAWVQRRESLMNLGWSCRTPEPTWHWFWQKTNNERTLNVRRWCKKDRFRLMCPVGKCLASFHFLSWPRFHRNSSNKCVNSWLEIEYCTHLKHFYPSVHFCLIYILRTWQPPGFVYSS